MGHKDSKKLLPDPDALPAGQARKLASQNRELAVKTLERVMRARKNVPDANAKVSAATKILEYADGRPASQTMAGEAASQSFTVVINNFGSDQIPELREEVSVKKMAPPVIDADFDVEKPTVEEAPPDF